MCICSVYKVVAFSFGSVFSCFFILQLIASVVLICKSLWIRASAKCIYLQCTLNTLCVRERLKFSLFTHNWKHKVI